MTADWQKRSLVLVAVFAFWRLIIMGITGFGDSEAYYWSWSADLALSYYDHPPMTAWLIRLFNEIGTENIFFSRLPSFLLFLGSCWFLYKITVRLFSSERAAFWALAFFNICPIFAFGALQMVPDIPAAFFWLMFIYLVIITVEEDRPNLWYAVGAVSGLALLSKYMALPLIPATLLMLGVHREYRQHLKRPHIYLGGVLGLIIFSPVLIWNYVNEFPSFSYHLTERHHSGSSFDIHHAAEALGGQILYYSPFMWFMLIYLCFYMGIRLFKHGEKEYAIPFWFGAPTLAFFMYITFWTVESEPHWTDFAFLSLFAGWGYVYTRAGKFFRWYTWGSLAFALVMVGVFYAQVFHPFLPIKNPRHDITNLLYGWPTVTEKINELTADLPGEDKYVVAHHYVLGGQLSFYLRDTAQVFVLSHAVDQYDFYSPKEPPKGADFVFVADNRFTEPPEKFYTFERRDEPVTVTITRSGKFAREFYLYKVYGFSGAKY